MSASKHLALALLLTAGSAWAGDYSTHPKAVEFIDKMVKEHGFKREALQQVLAGAEKKPGILEAIARPAEKTKPWYEYRQIFMGQERIDQGVEFWQQNEAVLSSVSEQYGVEPEVIVAIIGVETRYGRHMGNHRAVDALATLGFDYPPRGAFFVGQLEQLLILAREQNLDPSTLMGSYAGAMGYGQFIPSSYRHYARDHDGDGVADIWANKGDAIASVANYFKEHGWRLAEPVMHKVALTKPASSFAFNDSARPKTTVAAWRSSGVAISDAVDANKAATLLMFEQQDGPEYWLGFNNFYAITRYNRSHLYARAVWELSQAVKQAYASRAEQGGLGD